MIRLSDVLVFLLISVIVSILSKKFNISTVLGFLIGGILSGPYLGNMLSSTETIDFFSDIGVIFLLFTIGLHLPIEKIKTIKTYIFGFGAYQVFGTIIVYSLICHFMFHIDCFSSLILSFVVSLSSTALILKVLEDSGELATDYGRASFGTLLFQDFISVAAMTLIPIAKLESGGQSGTVLAVISLIKSLASLTIIVFIARCVIKPLYRWASENGSQTFMSITLIAIFGTASLTNYVGISMELGAFLAGVLMASSEYRLQVEADIDPFKELLMGLFFVTVGTSINFNLLNGNYLFILKIVLSIFLVKGLVIFCISKLIGQSNASGIKSAFLMSGGGEFSFVIFAAISSVGLLSGDKIQLFSLSISLTMALTPFMSWIGKVIAEKLELALLKKNSSDPKADIKTQNATGAVIIAGFGRTGQTVGTLLSQHLIPFIGIDNNIERVIQAQSKGLPVYYGDAKRRDVYRLLGAQNAKLVAVTLGKPSNSEKAASMLIQNFPKLNIWLRINDSERATSLEKAGIQVVVPEFFEPSLQIAKAVLKASGINSEDAEQSVNKYREKNKIKNVSTSIEEISK